MSVGSRVRSPTFSLHSLSLSIPSTMHFGNAGCESWECFGLQEQCSVKNAVNNGVIFSSHNKESGRGQYWCQLSASHLLVESHSSHCPSLEASRWLQELQASRTYTVVLSCKRSLGEQIFPPVPVKERNIFPRNSQQMYMSWWLEFACFASFR